MEKVWEGLKAALSGVENRDGICAAGVSAMMHGYLAFDADWNLLVPYRMNKAVGESLEEYLNAHVFAGVSGSTLAPDAADVAGFNSYIQQYKALLKVEQAAVESLI